MGLLKAYGKWVIGGTIIIGAVLGTATAAAYNTMANRAVFIGGGVSVENLKSADDWIAEGRAAVTAEPAAEAETEGR